MAFSLVTLGVLAVAAFPQVPQPAARAARYPLMPQVVGLRADSARTLLAARGIRLDSVRYSDVRPSAAAVTLGSVIGQSPLPRAAVAPGTPVFITVAGPPPQVTPQQPQPGAERQVSVPEVRGLTLAQARAALERRDLRASVNRMTTPAGASRDSVVDQRPLPGTLFPPGAVVALWLSAPDTEVTSVPELASLDSVQAVRELARTRLRLGRVTYGPSRWPRGIVYTQRPDAGTDVEVGSRVDIGLTGVRRVVVPDLRDSTEARARALLAQAGLRPGRITVGAAARPRRTVLEQSPPPQATVEVGTPVDLVLAGPPVPPPDRGLVTVPDVVGLPERDAADTLAGRGLVLAVTGFDSTATAFGPGRVVFQDPGPGEPARAGARVAVVLARPPAVPPPPNGGRIPPWVWIAGFGGLVGVTELARRLRRRARQRSLHGAARVTEKLLPDSPPARVELTEEPRLQSGVRFVPHADPGEVIIEIEEPVAAGGHEEGA